MIKQLTLFCIVPFLILTGTAVFTPLQAHCQKPPLPHSGDHPHCTKDPLIYDVYDVAIGGSGYDLVGTGIGWVYDGKAVGSLRPRDDLLDMSYFYDRIFDTPATANDCFVCDINPYPGYPCVRFGGSLRKQKKDTATGMFWFEGTTTDPSDGNVLYLLKVEGSFDANSDPLGFPKNEKIMRMDRWTLKIEGGGEVSSRACEGEGPFDPPIPVTFHVPSSSP